MLRLFLNDGLIGYKYHFGIVNNAFFYNRNQFIRRFLSKNYLSKGAPVGFKTLYDKGAAVLRKALLRKALDKFTFLI